VLESLKGRPRATYVAVQALFLAGVWALPANGWMQALWEGLAGWVSAAYVVHGVRRFAPPVAIAWYAIAAGMALNATGSLVEMVLWRLFDITTNPNVADLFWLALYPALIVGVGLLVRRRVAHEDLESTLLNTTLCVLVNLFLGIFAWELIVWRTPSDHSLTWANRLIVTLYPLADLMLIALVMRLLLGGGFRNVTVLLLTASLALLLAADVVWSGYLRNGTEPENLMKHLLHSSSIAGRALLAAAALHPSVRTTVPGGAAQPAPRLGVFGWIALGASVLTAPLVILLQAILDRIYSVTSF
jgi:hypothetical protein